MIVITVVMIFISFVRIVNDDILFSMMETYANNLEAIVDDRTRQVIGKISQIILDIFSTRLTVTKTHTNTNPN